MELDLKSMLRIMRRRWWVFIVLPLLIGALAYVATSRQDVTYETTVTIRVFPESAEGALDYNAIVGSQTLVETFRRLVISPPMLSQVIADLGLPYSVEDLQQRVFSASIRETQLFAVTVQDKDPQTAVRIADAIAQRFVERVPQPGLLATVVEPAPLPSSPVAPQIAVVVLLVIGAAVLVSITLVAFLEYLDDSVRETTNFPALVGAPLLTSIGRSPMTFRRHRRPLMIETAPRSPSAEALTVLRANVELAVRSQGSSTIVVCSPNTDEGRSTVAANLAVALARAHVSTVLIDADLRHARLHSLFGVRNRRGLTSLLTEPTEPWEEAVTDVGIPYLSLVTSGSVSVLPSTLLSVDRLRRRMDEIGRAADVVIVDTPPFLAYSDAFVVATSVDSAIIVCNEGQTRAPSVSAMYKRLQHSGTTILGIVLNRALPAWHPRRWWNNASGRPAVATNSDQHRDARSTVESTVPGRHHVPSLNGTAKSVATAPMRRTLPTAGADEGDSFHAS